MLILASRSPRRVELLRAAGLRFRVVVSGDDDEALPRRGREGWGRAVAEVALEKARRVAGRGRQVVLAADTVVVCEGRPLGKPANRREARQMLALLSGRWHDVYTGVALVCGDWYKLGWERTRVAFREISKREIDRYVASGEPMDKAGAYAIQGAGAAFVRAIRGCYTNVVGLPLPLVLRMLEEWKASTGVGNGGEGRESG